MNQSHNSGEFPRELNELEKQWLFSVLPDDKPGYLDFRHKLERLMVTGYGANEGMNYFLGAEDSLPDLTAPTASVFAAGTIEFTESVIDVVVHDEFEGMVEIDISLIGRYPLESERELRRWSYSSWVPGRKAPGDNSPVREIELIPGSIIIAVAPVHKRIWVYEKETGINHFIPVTNYYNELMRIKKIKNARTALNSNLLFENIDKYADQDLGAAFLIYNKYWRKIKLDYSYFMPEKAEKNESFLSRFFKRG